MAFSMLLMAIALILFGLGAWSRWWGIGSPDPRPYYSSFLCAGLFFATLAIMWPQLHLGS